MRQYNPGSEYFNWELGEAQELGAPEWMLNALQMNPDYTCWGVEEDYMTARGTGWNCSLIIQSWNEFAWDLDNYNEIVNFYFEIEKADDNQTILSVTFWVIHPRKGASRGVKVLNIQKCEVPQVVEYLKVARERNYQRFSKLDRL